MTTLEGRLRDPEYRNWVKSALCLQYTRDGLMTFTDLKSLELNQTVIHKLRQSGNRSVYNLCPTIAFDHRRKSVTCCTPGCTDCKDILKVVMQYRITRNLDLNLKNSDATKLLHQHWQVAKLFMNAGQDVSSTSPNNTDISGLLNFIDHCTVPKNYVTNQDNLLKVRDARNRILHTSSMKITEDEFQNVISPLLVDLLNDPGFLLTNQDANEAVEKIKDVQKADFIITQDNEKIVLDVLANEIRQIYELASDKMTELNDQIDTLNNDMSTKDCSNKAEVKQLRDEMKKNDIELSKVRDMCQMFRTQVEKSTDLHNEMRQQLKGIEEQTESTNESHRKLQIRVVDIEQRIGVMQKQIDSNYEEQTKLKEEQTELKEEQTRLKEEQTELKEEQTRLKEEVNAVKDENKPHKPSKEDKSRLQQYLIEGYTQNTHKLDVFLLPHWDKLHVSEIFTPSILIDDQHEKIETFERHGSLRETHSNKLAGDERLRSFKKLLFNGNELEKRVFLVGEAGAGKTTFCKHLTDMWCQINHTNEECKSPILQQLEDVTVLKQFQYLFYISCRFAEEKETIFDMINNQLFDDDKMKEIAKYVLKHNPEDCFIILDGADEWKGSPTSETGRRGDIAGLPGMAGVDSCVIFITSRPWRFHALSEKTQKFFRCLKLKGIADVNMLVESILQKHPEPVRSSKDFLKQVEENGMSDLMEIPLILLIALGCWIDDKSFHKFMCINYINMIQSLICRLKGHAGWLSSESRLRVFPILYDLERKWGQRSNELPPSLSTYKHLHRYAGLFLSLGQLAFDLLLGKGEQSLIFSKADLTSYLQADDENDESVNVCLALGILSKAETTKRGIKKVENYAFCHKTFQEIFAALWLTSGYTNEASKQYKYIENIQNLYSCDLMITFLCTIEPDTGKKFWIDLMEEDRIRVINLYETTMNHQSLQQLSGSLSSFSVLKSLELNHLRCSDHRDKCRCRIPVIDLRKCNQLKSLKLSYLLVEGLLLPREGVRFSELSLRQVSMTHRGIKQLSRSLSSLSCIEQLDLDELKCSEYRDMLCLPVLDLQKHNKLDKLELYGLYVEGLLLPMEGSRIRLLRLLNVRMAHHKLKQLSRSLSSLSCIEQLDLYGVRCSDRSRMPVLDLRKHNKLDLLELSDLYVEGLLLPMEGTRIRLLKLSNVKMAHHELEQLSRSLSSLSCLEQLDLDVVSCDDHRDMSCIPVLDLQKHSELEILCICGLSIERLLLPMERARIRQLALVNVTMAHHELEQLSRSVSSLSCIEQLDLDEVRCSEHRDRCCIPVLDLLQHNKLKELNIRKLSVESLLLSMRGARIRSLGLHNVTMTHHGLEELSRSLSSMSDTEYLSIDGVDCSEHRNSSCQCVKDIRA